MTAWTVYVFEINRLAFGTGLQSPVDPLLWQVTNILGELHMNIGHR